MTEPAFHTIHASAVLLGSSAVLIRGPSGSGKSQLAFDLMAAGGAPPWPPARLVGDDQVVLQAANGRLLVSPAAPLAGLIEIRGLGIRRCPHEARAPVGLIIDLNADDADRMPQPESLATIINGVKIPRLPVARAADPRRLILAWLLTEAAGN
ncbi:MAG: serine kinase [Xanthobacteraceae bacterium]|nr:MAG: serine kinase [Xanthobacteraceae bacterium]